MPFRFWGGGVQPTKIDREKLVPTYSILSGGPSSLFLLLSEAKKDTTLRRRNPDYLAAQGDMGQMGRLSDRMVPERTHALSLCLIAIGPRIFRLSLLGNSRQLAGGEPSPFGNSRDFSELNLQAVVNLLERGLASHLQQVSSTVLIRGS